MIWADKIALFLMAAIVLFLCVVGHPAQIELTGLMRLYALTVLPVWLLLRLVDFLAGGHLRRRSRFTYYRSG